MSRINIEVNGVRPKISVGDFVEICGNWYMVVNVENKFTFVALEDGFMYTSPRETVAELQSYIEESYQIKFVEGTTLHRTENVTMNLSVKGGK